MSKTTLKSQILKILLSYGCLNTTEVCRAVNGKEVFDPKICGLPTKLKPFGTGTPRVEGKLIHCQSDLTGECKHRYLNVRRVLHSLKINTIGMRFWDKTRLGGNGRRSDFFRFWFIDWKHFENRVLKQTLVPYIPKIVEV